VTISSQSRVVSLAFNPQPDGPGLCIYVPQWQGGKVILQDTRFPFRLLQLAALRPLPYWIFIHFKASIILKMNVNQHPSLTTIFFKSQISCNGGFPSVFSFHNRRTWFMCMYPRVLMYVYSQNIVGLHVHRPFIIIRPSTCTLRIIKWRRMRWEGHVERMGRRAVEEESQKERDN
jgi:hypothetical protein